MVWAKFVNGFNSKSKSWLTRFSIILKNLSWNFHKCWFTEMINSHNFGQYFVIISCLCFWCGNPVPDTYNWKRSFKTFSMHYWLLFRALELLFLYVFHLCFLVFHVTWLAMVVQPFMSKSQLKDFNLCTGSSFTKLVKQTNLNAILHSYWLLSIKKHFLEGAFKVENWDYFLYN